MHANKRKTGRQEEKEARKDDLKGKDEEKIAIFCV